MDRVQYDTFVEKARRFAFDTSDTELVDWTNINILDTKEYDKKSNIKVVSDDLLIQDLRNKIEAYESEIEKLHNEIVVLHSKNEELHSIVGNNKKTTDTLSTNIETPVQAYRKLKILVLGASTIKPKDIIGIAKRHGLTKHNLQLELDYSKNKRFDLTALRYTSPYSGILVGPVAHKITGLGDHSSILGLLKEEGFPPHVAIKTNSGTLKITKTAISTAFDNIMNQIGSYDPDFIPTV